MGLQSSLLASLNTTWKTQITLTYTSGGPNHLIFQSSRRLLVYLGALPITGTIIPLNNALISNSSIILYSNSFPANIIIDTYSFTVHFASNLFSWNGVMYTISSTNLTSTSPWVIRQYFELNMDPFYLIGIFLAIAGLVPILMRIRYIYRILIEYLHCLQLIGLTFFVLYPYSVHLNLYSFIKGFEYSNFSFMYNIPGSLIKPCLNCASLSSFSFIIGDMNWLRLIGSLLLCFIILLLICLVIYIFKCSRQYATYFVTLIVDLVLVKSIHSWFASLVYSGLNMRFYSGDSDFFILSMHMLSYILLVPLLYTRFKLQK